METLEERLAYLEGLLQHVGGPGTAGMPISQYDPASPQPPVAASDTAVDRDGSSGGRAQEDDGSTVDNLASKVGTLSLNAAGAEPHYLGSSSAFAFARLIKPSLSQLALQPSFFVRSQPPEDALSPVMCPLPDYATGVKFSNAYFQNIHAQYPFLHESTFRGWEAALLQPSETLFNLGFSPVPFFFLNMVRGAVTSSLTCVAKDTIGVCGRHLTCASPGVPIRGVSPECACVISGSDRA